MKRSPSRASRMYARTHARSRTTHPDVLGFLRRDARGYASVHRIRFACKLANAHHRRPSALDCRSRERETESSRRQRRRVPSGSRDSHLFEELLRPLQPAHLSPCSRTYSSISPCILVRFFSLSLSLFYLLFTCCQLARALTILAIRLPSEIRSRRLPARVDVSCTRARDSGHGGCERILRRPKADRSPTFVSLHCTVFLPF